MGQPDVNTQGLIDTAKALVAGDKGLLAMDESNSTCNKRFARSGIPQTEEARRAYRQLIVTTPGLAECINGAILCEISRAAAVPFGPGSKRIAGGPSNRIDALHHPR